MMSKIHLFTTNDLTYDRRMQRICRALSQSGYGVTLVGRRRQHSIECHFPEFHHKRFSCFFNSGFFFYAEINIRIFLFILFNSCDILCATDTDTLAGVVAAGMLKRKKMTYDAHEWFTEVPELQDSRWKKRAWALIEKWFIPKTHVCYTVSQTLADIFEQKWNRPFHVIRNLPEATGAAEGEERNLPDSPIILYQGALNQGRGLKEAIDAMHDLPACRLWLVGEGDLSMELRQYAMKNGLEDRVRFFGYQKPEDLPDITARAHIGLNLLENVSLNYYYSLANKFFDYMHAGIPSVHMNFPEYAAIIQSHPCGLLIDDLEKDHIVDAIRSLISDPKKWKAMSMAAIQSSRRFTWSAESQKLISIYKTL